MYLNVTRRFVHVQYFEVVQESKGKYKIVYENEFLSSFFWCLLESNALSFHPKKENSATIFMCINFSPQYIFFTACFYGCFTSKAEAEAAPTRNVHVLAHSYLLNKQRYDIWPNFHSEEKKKGFHFCKYLKVQVKAKANKTAKLCSMNFDTKHKRTTLKRKKKQPASQPQASEYSKCVCVYVHLFDIFN